MRIHYMAILAFFVFTGGTFASAENRAALPGAYAQAVGSSQCTGGSAYFLQIAGSDARKLYHFLAASNTVQNGTVVTGTLASNVCTPAVINGPQQVICSVQCVNSSLKPHFVNYRPYYTCYTAFDQQGEATLNSCKIGN